MIITMTAPLIMMKMATAVLTTDTVTAETDIANKTSMSVNKTSARGRYIPRKGYNSHTPCRAALIHTCHATPLPFPDSPS
jgi:hypothetical protein